MFGVVPGDGSKAVLVHSPCTMTKIAQYSYTSHKCVTWSLSRSERVRGWWLWYRSILAGVGVMLGGCKGTKMIPRPRRVVCDTRRRHSSVAWVSATKNLTHTHPPLTYSNLCFFDGNRLVANLTGLRNTPREKNKRFQETQNKQSDLW